MKTNELIVRAKNTDLGFMEKKKRIFIDLLLIFIGIAWIFTGYNLLTGKKSSYDASFIKCISGDTMKFEVSYKEEDIKLLAVNAPKVDDYYYNESSVFTCDLIENAKEIKIRFQDKKKKYDSDGKLLAFVFVDGVLLQEKLIEGGYAKVSSLNDYEYEEEFKKLEESAKNNKLGIWNNN